MREGLSKHLNKHNTLIFEDQKPKSNRNMMDIYVDDATGNCYYYNGEKLVLCGQMTPKLGHPGNRIIQREEAKARAERIKKEREEAERLKKEGKEYDEEALAPEETKEEREQRLRDIQELLDDDTTAEEAEKEAETKVKRDKELAKIKSDKLKRVAPKSSIQKFSESLRRFIANELAQQRSSTWERPNMSYEGSGIIRQGRQSVRNKHIPKINVYFDQSGSWTPSDIEIGMQALGVLRNYERRQELVIDIFYFANHIHTMPQQARDEGGTRAGLELLEHVIATRPDNVIVMTDSDIDYFADSIKESGIPKVKVPGAVWYLFRGSPCNFLFEWLKGRKQTKKFMI